MVWTTGCSKSCHTLECWSSPSIYPLSEFTFRMSAFTLSMADLCIFSMKMKLNATVTINFCIRLSSRASNLFLYPFLSKASFLQVSHQPGIIRIGQWCHPTGSEKSFHAFSAKWNPPWCFPALWFCEWGSNHVKVCLGQLLWCIHLEAIWKLLLTTSHLIFISIVPDF